VSLAMQAHFGNYNPSTLGWSRNPDLVPLEFGGTNFGQCARQVHGVFTAILTELVPHIPGGIAFGPHDDWAYSATDDLSDGSWSFHHYGIAFDLNWRENPMGTYSSNPDAGRTGAIPHTLASQIAEKYGCEYGGDWSGGDGHAGFKDFMHFECHLSPAVAATVQAPLTDWFDMATKDDLRAVLTDFLHAKDGKPYGIESLEREALSDVIAQVKQLTVDVAAIKKKLAA
jgi:hypothetical protein